MSPWLFADRQAIQSHAGKMLAARWPSPIAVISLITLALALLTGCTSTNQSTSRRQPFITQLEHELTINTGWVRIHAADALLDHGQKAIVTRTFAAESASDSSTFRTGIWRVMARATPTDQERQNFIARIRRVMHDPNAADRLQAAESLCKLGASDASDIPMLEQWLKTADDATAPFPQWLLILSHPLGQRSSHEARLTKFLESDANVARLRAGFALGRLKNIEINSALQLTQQAQREPSDSIARVYLKAAALLHEPPHSLAIPDLKKELSAYLKNGLPNEQLEAATILGRCGTAQDLPRLAPLLTNPEADARIGAATGSLYLLR